MNSIDIIKIREELGLTQQKFADRIGVDRRTVVNWEHGKKIPESKVKLFEMLLEIERKPNGINLFDEKPEFKAFSPNDLAREILELKDHIKTLKEFLEGKTTIAEIYKNENFKLKEEIEALKNG